jgi:tRNA acetyltransferase TAN1
LGREKRGNTLFSGARLTHPRVRALTRRYNILATTERINESRAGSELWMLLRAVGDEAPIVDRMGIWGIIVAMTSLEPAAAVSKMREEFLKKPDSVQALFRVIPIQRLVPTRLGSHEIIDAVADVIDRKVNLDNPDWVVLVETAGRMTGVSVVHPSEILNVQKERVHLSTEAKKRATLNYKLT